MDSQVQVAERPGRLAWLVRTVAFVRASWDELPKVSWPTWNELYLQTRAIVILSVILGLLIGWMDLLLQLVLVDGIARLTR
ncbi:MAG TPA: preprotein translocase subunit SecE [Gemmatimonadales bacterium]|nr:preprotein translocase subunit SecE [Gemmatimonadales bacterium]